MSSNVLQTEVQPKLTFRTWFLLVAACVGNAQQLFSIVATASLTFSTIATLGGSEIATWQSQAFSIAPAALGPSVALASDLFGRRCFLLLAYSLGFAGAIISGRASSMGMLIAGRFLAASPTLVQPLILTIPSEILPHRWRPVGQAALGASGGFAAVLALVISGVFLKYVDTAGGQGWRWVWYIEAIFMGLTFAITALLYRPLPHPDMVKYTRAEKFAKLDFVTSFLLLGAMVPLFIALQNGDNPYPWSNPHAYAPAIVGGVFCAILGLYAWKGRRDGLVNHHLFSRGRNFALCVFSLFVEGMVFIGYINYYGAQTATTWESDPILINLRLATLFLAAGISAPIVGWYSVKTKNLKLTLVVGYTLFLIALIGLAATSRPQDAKLAIFWGVLLGWGITMPNLNLWVIAQLSIPAHLMGSASGLALTARSLGGGVSLAIIASVVNSKLGQNISSKIAAAALADGIPANTLPTIFQLMLSFDFDGLRAVITPIHPGDVEGVIARLVRARKEGFGASYRFAWIILVPFVCVAIGCIFMLSDPRDDMNYKIDAPAEEIELPRRSLHSLRLERDLEEQSRISSKIDMDVSNETKSAPSLGTDHTSG